MANRAEVADSDAGLQPGPSNRRLAAGDSNNTLQLPPSQSSLSMRSDFDDTSSAGYMTASSSRVSQLDSEPLTALPRISLASLQSSTPRKGSSPAKSPSSSSMGAEDSSDDTDQMKMASLSSVTTFVPSTLSDLESSEEEQDDIALTDPNSNPVEGSSDADFIPSYDFDLRDPHERTVDHRHNDDEDAHPHEDNDPEHDQTLTARDAREGDIITVSHSHSTSLHNSSIPHSRAASQTGSASYHDNPHQHTSFPMSLSSSWPSLSLPPSAVRLHRKRRNILVRLLKTWEGREQILHLSYSLVLLFYSSLDHPVPQTYRGAIMRPAGTVLAMSFPKPVRVALMQRIYTTAEGIDNFRRAILIARWITSATEAVMDHWQHRQDHKRQQRRAAELAEREQLEIKLTGDEPIDTELDHVQGGFRWLQPSSVAPFDATDDEKGEQSFAKAPAAKIGKMTGRGDATGAVGADVAENEAGGDKNATTSPKRGDDAPASSVTRTFARLWASIWRLPHLEAAAESLATVGEACEAAAVLAGGGMFWRAVGFQRLGLPFLSRRRRNGIERLGIVLSLCSVLLSLLVLRMERKALRSELRSAHRRIIRANDKLGWSTDLAGTTIDRDQALSHRQRDPSIGARSRRRRRSSGGTEEKLESELLGSDLQAAARDLDDQRADSESVSSSSDSTLSDTWTVVPDGDDAPPQPISRSIYNGSYASHGEEQPRRRSHRHHHTEAAPTPIDMTSLLKSTERSLVRAESDLRKARRRIQLNFWEKLANWSEAIFLGYEAAMPHVDKEGVEGWTGLVASTIRLSSLWKQITWG